MPSQKDLDRARAAGYKAAQTLNREEVITYMLSHKCKEVYKWCGVSELAFRFVKEALGIDGKQIKAIKNRIGLKQANISNQELYKARKQNLISKVPKDDLITFKSSHTIPETIKHFDIKRDDYDKLLSYYGCTYLTSEKFEDVISRIDKCEFITYYKSHNNVQTKNNFNLSDGHFTKLVKLWQLSKTSEEVGKIIRNTMLDKYGVTNSEFIPGVAERKKTTWLSKYGTDHPMRSDNIKRKCEEYFLHTYGVSSPCMLNKCADASRVKISKPNLLIAERLKSLGLVVELEFPLEGYSFDIKVGRTLIEVDPYAFHNITWHPFNNPLPKEYHLNKSKIGWKNDYNVMHIFDWDDIEDIEKLLIDNSNNVIDSDIVEIDNSKANFIYLKESGFEIINQIEPQLHYYNGKTKEHIIDTSRDRDELLDAGFVEIFDCGKTIWRKMKNGN